MGRTEHRGERDTEEGEDTGKKRIDLSVSQVVGAGVATLAAATAASYLNVYGTIVGAAVMATLSTVASPFLQHWFSRGGDQARQFAEKAVGHTEPAGTGSHRTGTHPLDPPGTGPVPGVPPTGPIPGLPEEPDATRTMALPVPRADATVRMPAVPDGPEEPVTPYGGPEQEPDRRGWRAYAVPAAVVFGLVMLVILLFELFTGRSLTAWTQGQDEHTSPTLLGGSSAPPAREDGGTDDIPADGGDRGRQEEDGAGQGSPDPTDEPSEPEPTAPATEQPPGDGDGQTDPTTPGDDDTTDPGDGQTDPGTGDGGSDSGGTEDQGGAGGTGSEGSGDALPEVPAG
ncbi:hypothetical protein [Nocardiopsis sp. CC223A]|uniref:hypothetical protein n=1 Tax=Nocardiopsis sp. CC223A TaxID=3044051 RepID=UPI00278C0C72|nr:hypothetical protein [Nocardiopsis sp. CC223A]